MNPADDHLRYSVRGADKQTSVNLTAAVSFVNSWYVYLDYTYYINILEDAYGC